MGGWNSEINFLNIIPKTIFQSGIDFRLKGTGLGNPIPSNPMADAAALPLVARPFQEQFIGAVLPWVHLCHQPFKGNPLKGIP